MNVTRFVMVGGFLGAGKTTVLAQLARHYLGQGRRVALVTNDQAYDLVDTRALRAQGFQVGEVPGACFCCKFDDLVEAASQWGADSNPEVILAEPVGSCTDLVATVIEPLRHLYGQRFDVAPLAVLLKPEHGRKILRSSPGAGFSPKAAYIFLKQIEEADVVCLNKIDKFGDAERRELLELVRERFPDKQVLAISARAGSGLDALVAAIEAPRPSPSRFMDVDYEVYAAGEAELGWLNCQTRLSGAEFLLDELLVDLIDNVRRRLLAAGAEPAHLKVLGEARGEAAVANLVGSEADVELSVESGVRTAAAELIVNARVAADPERLELLVRDALRDIADEFAVRHEFRGVQRCRPGRPVPTHRHGA